MENTESKDKVTGGIRQLQDKDLIGGVCDKDIYPVTSTSAVKSVDKEGNAIKGVKEVLEDRLADIEAGVKGLETEIKNIQGGEKEQFEELSEDEVQFIINNA